MVNEVGEMDSVSPDDHNNSGISVFEIDSPDYKLNFLSWILDITQEEADKGFEFLKRNNSDYLQKARKYGHFTGYKN